MELKEKVSLIAKEYEFNVATAQKYLNTLLEYPFINVEDEDQLLCCLELIIAERTTQKLITEQNVSKQLKRSLKETIIEMIYNVYGDKAIDHLDDEFVKQKRLILNNNPYLEDKGYLNSELDYNGYE